MRREAEGARVFAEDGHDIVRQLVAVGRDEAVHVVLHRTHEVCDAEVLLTPPRRLEKTATEYSFPESTSIFTAIGKRANAVCRKSSSVGTNIDP